MRIRDCLLPLAIYYLLPENRSGIGICQVRAILKSNACYGGLNTVGKMIKVSIARRSVIVGDQLIQRVIMNCRIELANLVGNVETRGVPADTGEQSDPVGQSTD